MKKILILQIIGWAQIALATATVISLCMDAGVQFVKSAFNSTKKPKGEASTPVYVTPMTLPPQAEQKPVELLDRDQLISRSKPFQLGAPLELGAFYADIPVYVVSLDRKGQDTFLQGMLIDKTATTQETAITKQRVTIKVLDPNAKFEPKKAYSFEALEYQRNPYLSLDGALYFVDRTRY